jgi:hypothetical protein
MITLTSSDDSRVCNLDVRAESTNAEARAEESVAAIAIITAITVAGRRNFLGAAII